MVDENGEVDEQAEALYHGKLREVKEACQEFQDAFFTAANARDLYLARVVRQK